jgi:hypothetical protein
MSSGKQSKKRAREPTPPPEDLDSASDSGSNTDDLEVHDGSGSSSVSTRSQNSEGNPDDEESEDARPSRSTRKGLETKMKEGNEIFYSQVKILHESHNRSRKNLEKTATSKPKGKGKKNLQELIQAAEKESKETRASSRYRVSRV